MKVVRRVFPSNAHAPDVHDVERRLTALAATFEEIMRQAIGTGNVELVLLTGRRLESQYALLYQIRRELHPYAVSAPDQLDVVREVLLAALEQYPDAKRAAAKALMEATGDGAR